MNPEWAGYMAARKEMQLVAEEPMNRRGYLKQYNTGPTYDSREDMIRVKKDVECIFDKLVAMQRDIGAIFRNLDDSLDSMRIAIDCIKTKQEVTRSSLEVKLEQINSRLEPVNVDAECPVCMVNKKNVAIMGCGHTLCEECGILLSSCPVCRMKIDMLVKVYL
jgi:hypothetical protein